MRSPQSTKPSVEHTKWVVEGLQFNRVVSVYNAAVSKGFKGCQQTLSNRLHAGASTWDALCAPLQPRHAESLAAANRVLLARKKAEKAEMAAICARLDKRRAEIAKAAERQEQEP